MYSKKEEIPRQSSILCRPTRLKTEKNGIYSIDFQNGKKREVTVSEIHIFIQNNWTNIEMKDYFECNLNDPINNTLRIILYDENEQEIAYGAIELYANLVNLKFLEMSFEPLFLSYFYIFH